MPAPDPSNVAIFTDAAEFRAWLLEHHDTVDELWVGYYKKGVPKTSMTYPEAVEEALCFGWIDGIASRIDDEVYANRFTPRRSTSIWSAINIAKMAELKAAGRLHPAGIRAFEERDRRKDATYTKVPDRLPEDALARLEAAPAAWEFWQQQPPGYRRNAAQWVMSAKREDTRERRLTTLIEDSAAGRRIKPLSYGRGSDDRSG